jgi:hypothetical protein
MLSRPASLDDVIKTCESLHVEEKHQFKISIQKYEHLFGGNLGEFIMEPIILQLTWKIKPISLQLMDPNCKLIHERGYTVPRS